MHEVRSKRSQTVTTESIKGTRESVRRVTWRGHHRDLCCTSFVTSCMCAFVILVWTYGNDAMSQVRCSDGIRTSKGAERHWGKMRDQGDPRKSVKQILHVFASGTSDHHQESSWHREVRPLLQYRRLTHFKGLLCWFLEFDTECDVTARPPAARVWSCHALFLCNRKKSRDFLIAPRIDRDMYRMYQGWSTSNTPPTSSFLSLSLKLF